MIAIIISIAERRRAGLRRGEIGGRSGAGRPHTNRGTCISKHIFLCTHLQCLNDIRNPQSKKPFRILYIYIYIYTYTYT